MAAKRTTRMDKMSGTPVEDRMCRKCSGALERIPKGDGGEEIICRDCGQLEENCICTPPRE